MSSLQSGQLLWLPNSNIEAHVEEQVAPRFYSVNTRFRSELVRESDKDVQGYHLLLFLTDYWST